MQYNEYGFDQKYHTLASKILPDIDIRLFNSNIWSIEKSVCLSYEPVC